jgi:hypothetical protein
MRRDDVRGNQGSDDAVTRDASQVICDVYHEGWLLSLYGAAVWERETDRKIERATEIDEKNPPSLITK